MGLGHGAGPVRCGRIWPVGEEGRISVYPVLVWRAEGAMTVMLVETLLLMCCWDMYKCWSRDFSSGYMHLYIRSESECYRLGKLFKLAYTRYAAGYRPGLGGRDVSTCLTSFRSPGRKMPLTQAELRFSINPG
jgi:hypothetical protein